MVFEDITRDNLIDAGGVIRAMLESIVNKKWELLSHFFVNDTDPIPTF